MSDFGPLARLTTLRNKKVSTYLSKIRQADAQHGRMSAAAKLERECLEVFTTYEEKLYWQVRDALEPICSEHALSADDREAAISAAMIEITGWGK